MLTYADVFRCEGGAVQGVAAEFTCVTSTEVQILTEGRQVGGAGPCKVWQSATPCGVGTRFTCINSIKVQILTPEKLSRWGGRGSAKCRS
jgi:hypothetical protein